MPVNGEGLYNSEWLKVVAQATDLARKYNRRYKVKRTLHNWYATPVQAYK